MQEPLPGEDCCPKCGSAASPLLWQLRQPLTRVYKCPDCKQTWSVEGAQESIDLGDQNPPAGWLWPADGFGSDLR